MFTGTAFAIFFTSLTGLVILLAFIRPLTGLVIITERQVGIVIKRFGHQLPPGKLLALKGEAGLQADTLAPGWHLGYFPWQYSVHKVPMTIIPQGEIGLVVPIPT